MEAPRQSTCHPEPQSELRDTEDTLGCVLCNESSIFLSRTMDFFHSFLKFSFKHIFIDF